MNGLYDETKNEAIGTKRVFPLLIIFMLLSVFSACAAGRQSTGSQQSGAVSQASAGSSSSEPGSVPESSAVSSAVSSASDSSRSSAKTPGTASSGSSGAASGTAPQSSAPAQPKTVRVVIPEGFTLSQIGDRLEANGVCKKAELLKTANSYDFSYYSLIGSLTDTSHRCYRLEGYLYPDTYEFYTDMKPQDALGKMLRSAQSRIGSKYAYPGMTADQVVTLASIIEKESGSAGELAKISSVFHNRLKIGMRLQADPTINYIERYVKPNLDDSHKNDYNSYYNTYKCAALPTGPICSPGAAALNAAAHPADTNSLYFCADKNGNYYYAKTFEEHKANLAKGGIVAGNSLQ